jgi:hypothetical protein
VKSVWRARFDNVTVNFSNSDGKAHYFGGPLAYRGSFVDITWFPDHHRWTIQNECTHVFLDYDSDYPAYYEQYTDQVERDRIAAKLGARPTLALHVQISTVYPGSAELADRVIHSILGRWNGVVEDS